MPKRKRSKSDYDEIRSEIKKLKKKLKHARDRDRSDSSTSESMEPMTDNITVELDDLIDLENDDTLAESPTVTETTCNTNSSNQEENNLPATKNTSEQNENTVIDKDILDILGDDPSTTVQYGQEIHKELANRLEHITTSGLTKEARKELQTKYLLPSNAILLGAPCMNPEIKAALPETLVNRDKAIETKQKLLGSAIACLSQATSQLIGSQQKDKELLKKLMDANRMLCDIQHSDSVTRRMFSTSVLKKDVKTQILNSKIDKLLFGENLPDTLKTAKAVSKSSAEIKSTPNNNVRKTAPSTSKTSNLNSRAPAAPTRKPPANTQQKTKPTASHQNQPARSSRTSSQPRKTTNNRR